MKWNFTTGTLCQECVVGCLHRNHLGWLADPRWIAGRPGCRTARRPAPGRQGIGGGGPRGSVRRRDGSRSGGRSGAGSQVDQQRPAADLRRRTGGRRLLQPRRLADGVPERTRGGQSLFPDLPAGPGQRRHGARLARARQDDVRLDSSRREPRAVRLDARRPGRAEEAGRRNRTAEIRPAAALLVGLRRALRAVRVGPEDRRLHESDEHARLRRGRIVVAGRPLDRVHLEPPGVHASR